MPEPIPAPEGSAAEIIEQSASQLAEIAAEVADEIAVYNRAVRDLFDQLPWSHPVGMVQWVHIDQVHPNGYNPNSVAHHEMRLLHTSIDQDGYTQPVVAIEDENNPGHYEIVDGFHRYTIMRNYRDIYATTGGYLPLVVIDKPLADRIASTVRHNRARGKHSVNGMSSLVFRMLEQGETDEAICNKIGLEAEELVRLKYITGFAKLHMNHEYSRAFLTDRQVKAKAHYKRDHPDEPVPTHI